jgi:nitronate monooxygenase
MTDPHPERPLPTIIQGGMGVSVSNWHLASTVARAGQLGVVSGTGLAGVVAYRLQEGDPDGHIRRVLARFPVPALAERVLAKWYLPGGLARAGVYRPLPMITHELSDDNLALLVVTNFVEIALAKEGHDGLVGLNLLEKIQVPNLASIYGAMLAGVDVVLMGAGIPREIPGALDHFANHEPASLRLQVEGAVTGEDARLHFAPRELMGSGLPPLRRPRFLAIVASDTLAQSLMRTATGTIDGFVIEGPTAGGHNAPPRGREGTFNARGEPVYGVRDQVDHARFRAIGLPFWLAGGFGSPEGLAAARAQGAQGVQVGTAFAFCEESGLDPALKQRVLAAVRAEAASVFTDPKASPTGFPFKVVELPGTISEAAVYDHRRRVCTFGYLRQAYRTPTGEIGWRCGAEPEAVFRAKGGTAEAALGRKCICNGLMATAGHALAIAAGGFEPSIITAGDDLPLVIRFLAAGKDSYTVREVIDYLLGPPAAGK